jgi:hypothetical protein
VNKLSMRVTLLRLSLAALVLAAPALAGEYSDYKVLCPGVGTLGWGAVKPEWVNKDLSKAQCVAEVRRMRAILKTWTGNISTPMVGCALYCSELYKLKF